MKAIELRNKEIRDLNTELHSLLKTHFVLRMQLATQQLSNNAKIKLVKKDIARIKTVITQKTKNHDN